MSYWTKKSFTFPLTIAEDRPMIMGQTWRGKGKVYKQDCSTKAQEPCLYLVVQYHESCHSGFIKVLQGCCRLFWLCTETLYFFLRSHTAMELWLSMSTWHWSPGVMLDRRWDFRVLQLSDIKQKNSGMLSLKLGKLLMIQLLKERPRLWQRRWLPTGFWFAILCDLTFWPP